MNCQSSGTAGFRLVLVYHLSLLVWGKKGDRYRKIKSSLDWVFIVPQLTCLLKRRFLRCFRKVFSLFLSNKMDFFTSIPTHIDYVGQAKAEKLYRAIITLFSIVGFIWGYIVQQFSQSVYILGAGFLLAAILTVPPWPMYRRNPLNWQNPKSTDEKPTNKKGKK